MPRVPHQNVENVLKFNHSVFIRNHSFQYIFPFPLLTRYPILPVLIVFTLYHTLYLRTS